MHMPYLEHPMSMYGYNRIPSNRPGSAPRDDLSGGEFTHMGTYSFPMMNHSYPSYPSYQPPTVSNNHSQAPSYARRFGNPGLSDRDPYKNSTFEQNNDKQVTPVTPAFSVAKNTPPNFEQPSITKQLKFDHIKIDSSNKLSKSVRSVSESSSQAPVFLRPDK